jgi:glutamine amidotransferase
MKNLEERGLAKQIRDLAAKGVPTLGICLGMQLLMNQSEELGTWQGLGLIPGRVVGFDPPPGQRAKVPQIGWNSVEPPQPAGGGEWSSQLLRGIEPGAYMYFVHSFAVLLDDPGDLVAETEYAGLRFCSVLANGNVYGAQFHPEKSGAPGLTLISNFLAIVDAQ